MINSTAIVRGNSSHCIELPLTMCQRNDDLLAARDAILQSQFSEFRYLNCDINVLLTCIQ
jgi:hypothetical protein